MITVEYVESRVYNHVSPALFASTDYPRLCTFTVGGKFGFVFCDSHDDEVIRYIKETNSSTAYNITFWNCL